MQSNIETIGNRTLQQICIPGSHDAGMSSCTAPTAFAGAWNTVTQTQTILGQLNEGSRYFDIRPAIGGGEYYTGHYGKIFDLTYQGARGQSIQDIINDVNNFTSNNNELIILDLAHDFNTDTGNSSYQPFTQSEWNVLFNILTQINNRFVTRSEDLKLLTLNDFIKPGGTSKAAVVILVSTANVDLGSYAAQGFYPSSYLQIYNNYANSDDLGTMISNQFGKMENKNNYQNQLFLLSWTLTQQTKDILDKTSILSLASIANSGLYPQSDRFIQDASKQIIPNIILIDNLCDSGVTAMCILLISISHVSINQSNILNVVQFRGKKVNDAVKFHNTINTSNTSKTSNTSNTSNASDNNQKHKYDDVQVKNENVELNNDDVEETRPPSQCCQIL